MGRSAIAELLNGYESPAVLAAETVEHLDAGRPVVWVSGVRRKQQRRMAAELVVVQHPGAVNLEETSERGERRSYWYPADTDPFERSVWTFATVNERTA